jgi:GST-like protein
VHQYQQVRRWADEVGARTAVQRGRKVNRMRGKPEEQVAERHEASDLD